MDKEELTDELVEIISNLEYLVGQGKREEDNEMIIDTLERVNKIQSELLD